MNQETNVSSYIMDLLYCNNTFHTNETAEFSSLCGISQFI